MLCGGTVSAFSSIFGCFYLNIYISCAFHWLLLSIIPFDFEIKIFIRILRIFSFAPYISVISMFILIIFIAGAHLYPQMRSEC